MNLFCELTCSPRQSLFMNATTVTPYGAVEGARALGNASNVVTVQYYIENQFANGEPKKPQRRY